jgi:FdhD protein
MNDRVVVAAITRVAGDRASTDQDLVAAEAPLEILLAHPAQTADGGAAPAARSLGVTMRTPGDDRDLVVGFLISEQIVCDAGDVIDIVIEPAAPRGTDQDEEGGQPAPPARARVTLAASVDLDAIAHTRVIDRSSACGLCGRLAVQAVRRAGRARTTRLPIDPAIILSMPEQLRRRQAVFAETGGLHAAALCGTDGTPWLWREDVGRHNAVDKVIGAALLAGQFPALDAWLAVSGRVAFEIVQKACAAGVAGVVAVGAPSSLAVDAARAAGLTLVGFARDGRFNIYAGRERIASAGEIPPA